MPDTPEPWFRDGLRFTCTQCGKCCTGDPGFVWVDDDEIDKLAAARGMVRHEFVAMFTHKTRGRVSLRERANGDCIFYDAAKGCTVYAQRPKQCRTWPFWDSNIATPEDWARTESVCPGSGEGELIPVEEILKRAKQIKM
jgi:Fe-S-cluster containining protein